MAQWGVSGGAWGNLLKLNVWDLLGSIGLAWWSLSFFFLTVLFALQDYPGPYRNCEKGLLILYQLVKNCSMEQMGRFIPRSSFYDIYRAFYNKQAQILDRKLSAFLASMFSTIQIRILL